MKNVFFLAIIALSVSVTAAQTKTINLSTFGRAIRGVDASSAFHVNVIKGNQSSAVAKVPSRYAANVFLTLDTDGVVNVGLRNVKYNRHQSEKLQLTIVCPTIEDIEVSSAASVYIQSDFSASKLDIDASSAGKVSGVGKMKVNNKTEIECSSAASVKLDIVSSRIEVDASSASTIELTGSTSSLGIEASSASAVDCFGLVADNANVVASSSSSVSVKATRTLKAAASSVASITYDCPENGVTVKKDKLSSVKRK